MIRLCFEQQYQYDVISKHNLDLIHVHYAIPHAYAGYMAKTFQFPMELNILEHHLNNG